MMICHSMTLSLQGRLKVKSKKKKISKTLPPTLIYYSQLHANCINQHTETFVIFVVLKIGPTTLGQSICCCLLIIGTLTTILLPPLAPGRDVWDVLATSITATTGRVEPGEMGETGP